MKTKYIDAETARQHLTDRLMECALNNVGIKTDADEVFRDIAENRLPVWIGEIDYADVQEVKHGRWTREVLGSTSGYGTTVMYRCSTCGSIAISKYSYCPNCRSSMVNEYIGGGTN